MHEADLIVSLFTREAGKIKGVAKSASKSRRRFGGALEPMTHVRALYVTKPRQELVRLDSLEILRSPLSEPADYGRAAALAFYTEVLDEMLPDGVPPDAFQDRTQDATFRLLLSVLEQTRVGRIWMPVTYFALWMVRLLGSMPDTRRCTLCGRSFRADEPGYFHPDADGLFCEEHRRLGWLALAPASRALAEEVFRGPPERFAAQSWPRNRAADLRRFAVQALERHGEQRLQSAAALARLPG